MPTDAANHSPPPAPAPMVLAHAGDAQEQDRFLALERARLEHIKNALEPADYPMMKDFAQEIVKSGMFVDKDGRAPTLGSILLRVMTGRQLGISSTIALQHVYDLYGRVGISAALKRALVRRHPECERYEMAECTSESCTWVVKRRGNTEKKFTFTVADAKQAGVWKKDGNWDKWGRRMLQARASSEAADVEFSDAILGLESIEDIVDSGSGSPALPPVVSASTAPAVLPGRDWAKEADAMATKVKDLVGRGEMKTARELYNLFAQEAPQDALLTLKGAYNAAVAEAKAKAPAPTASPKVVDVQPPPNAGDAWEPPR